LIWGVNLQTGKFMDIFYRVHGVKRLPKTVTRSPDR
jgi:hypothetical protein